MNHRAKIFIKTALVFLFSNTLYNVWGQHSIITKHNIFLPLKHSYTEILSGRNPLLVKGPIIQTDTISFAFIGDLMQHLPQINSALIKGKDPALLESYDYSHTFKYLKNRFNNTNIACVNMECPLGDPPFSGYPNFNAPKAVALEAAKSGLNIFFTANNHIADKGGKGIASTLNFYKSNNYKYTGCFLNEYDSKVNNPLIVIAKGLKIAFINFTYGTNGIKVPAPYRVNTMDSCYVKELINRAKEEEADIIIAVPHWGNEYQLKASSYQKKWAKMLHREGVRIIIGSHPHVVQNWETDYDVLGNINTFVAYSLGNFVSNQSDEFTQLGLLVEFKVVKERLSNRIKILEPNMEYLWCFKHGQVEKGYTVVPVKDILNGGLEISNKVELEKLKKTYYKHVKGNGKQESSR